jgi:hypothetical protein
VLGLATGIYLTVNKHLAANLGTHLIDAVTGTMLTGFILLLIGFALFRGSKVIRFFDTLLWATTGIWAVYTAYNGSDYWYLLLLITIPILDYLLFNITSREYFERMA